jgi:myo-inositol-1(or 4)-monophosphatase
VGKQALENVIELIRIREQTSMLALAVGEFIRRERVVFKSEQAEQKALHDLVSYVDRTSEEKLVEQLKQIMPQAGFINEESGRTHEHAEWVWVVDPLDGTTNFVHGIPHYCISIALLHEGMPMVGVVYDVATNDLFTAVKGQGSTLNNKKITVSAQNDIRQSLIGTGFPVNRFDRLDGYLEVLRKVIMETRGVRRIGTAALDLCYVAAGRFEAFYEIGLNIWDVAAGVLIVQEAGGKVSDFKGGENYLEGREIVASNEQIHSVMLSWLGTV